METSSGTSFYESLPAFEDFSAITEEDNFHAVPGDWSMLVTDIKNSNRAIEEGRYRDVNKLGAATMAVVRRRYDDASFPFVFGGDGATLVVPPRLVEDACRELAGLRELTRDRFDMELRAARLPVSELNARNLDLQVGKYRLAGEQTIAFFRGGGFEWAQKEIKRNENRYKIQADPTEPVHLDGLSCRWQPIPSKRGTMLTIIVLSLSENPAATYDRILEELDSTIDGGLENTNPVNSPEMTYDSLMEIVNDEHRYHTSNMSLPFLLRFLEILLAVVVFRFGLHPLFINPEEYRKSLETHSDYLKFDDQMRLVMDCTPEEAKIIEDRLENLREEGDIVYGLHASDSALMTCYVEELSEGGHVHFIDGDQGGYTVAAQQLKSQLSRLHD